MDADRAIGSLMLIGAMLAILACFAMPVGIVYLMIRYAYVWLPPTVEYIEANTWLKVMLYSVTIGNGIILANWVIQWFICWLREEC